MVLWEGTKNQGMLHRAASSDGQIQETCCCSLAQKILFKRTAKGKECRGGRKGKLLIDGEILERVKATYFVFLSHRQRGRRAERLRGEEHRYKSRVERPV